MVFNTRTLTDTEVLALSSVGNIDPDSIGNIAFIEAETIEETDLLEILVPILDTVVTDKDAFKQSKSD